jgi:hypothetical protein
LAALRVVAAPALRIRYWSHNADVGDFDLGRLAFDDVLEMVFLVTPAWRLLPELAEAKARWLLARDGRLKQFLSLALAGVELEPEPKWCGGRVRVSSGPMRPLPRYGPSMGPNRTDRRPLVPRPRR